MGILFEKEFSCFHYFNALVENNSGQHIKILRTNRGGEYMSNEFLNFCKTHGIQNKFIAWYTPQQNGIGLPYYSMNEDYNSLQLSDSSLLMKFCTLIFVVQCRHNPLVAAIIF